MRILYDHQIFSSQPQGGVSRYFAELLKGCRKLGISTQTAWRYSANRHLKEWDPGSQDWWPKVSFRGKAHLTGWLNRSVSTHALESDSWDVFHPTYYDPYFLPRLDDRPFVLTIHDMIHELYPEGLSDRKVLPGRKRLLAERATRVVAVSENTRQDIIHILGIDPAKVITVPHGNSLRPGTVDPIPPAFEGPFWLYIGSRSAYKNWSLVVEALRYRNNPSDRLVMIGGGALNGSELVTLSRAGLSSRAFHVRASDSQLAGWYTRAKALIYPSLYEGFGMPLLEAMAWGCPVLSAQASCLPEIGGGAAVYFDPHSPASLVSALSQMDDVGCRNECIRAGRLREEYFTWEKSVEATVNVYSAALKG